MSLFGGLEHQPGPVGAADGSLLSNYEPPCNISAPVLFCFQICAWGVKLLAASLGRSLAAVQPYGKGCAADGPGR